MSTLTLEDAIILAGGAVTLDSRPDVIPEDAFKVLLATLYRTNEHFIELSRLRGRDIRWLIVLTQSTGLSCAVRELDHGYAILVPIGMVARARVAARLLLRHWRAKECPRFIRSPDDRIDDDPQTIPPLLEPIFLESLSDEVFWKRLLELDRSLDVEVGFEPDVKELVHLAVLYLLSHEFTHVLHGHFDLIAQPRAGSTSVLDSARLSRGLELDADDGAAAITLWILDRDIHRAREAGRKATVELGWMRLGYAVTMLLGISDATRKYYGAYDDGHHNHPLIRCELFFESGERAIRGSEEIKAAWRENTNEGWLRCLVALEILNWEAVAGKFGLVPRKHQGPLHPQYGAVSRGPINYGILERVRQAAALRDEVRKLLPIFNRLPAHNGSKRKEPLSGGS